MPRILFVKTSSLGDVVHNFPAVTDAARAIPQAEIDWVVEETFAELAGMHPAVRRVIPVAIRRWRRSLWRPSVWTEMAHLRRILAESSYDTIVDTQGLVKSAVITRLARGRRHGPDRRSAREALASGFYDARHAVERGRHAVERNRLLAAAALGYRAEGEAMYGLAQAPEGEISGAMLLTMTSREDKLWPEASWAELGRVLTGRGLQVTFPWGSAAERSRCERIARGIPDAVVLPERWSIARLGGAFRRARVIVGLDSGLTHLAAALGRPVVGIFHGSDPSLTGLYAGRRAVNIGAPGRPPAPADVIDALENLR